MADNTAAHEPVEYSEIKQDSFTRGIHVLQQQARGPYCGP